MFRPIVLARIFFVILATTCGFWMEHDRGPGANLAIIAFIVSMVVVLFEYSLRMVSSKRVFLASIGMLFGLIVSTLVYETIPEGVMSEKTARIACNFLFGYLGMIIALKHADQINFGNFRFTLPGGDASQTKILDTSIIIDGRIQDMLGTGFITGTIIVPSFVIDELQRLADSADSIKRGKGRRGLGIIEEIQNEYPALEIVEKDYPDTPEVDRKLLEMAKEINGQVVTNDHNLQKVAALHRVSVLNLNELADMLRPPVFVGETFELAVIREGKESSQGVGYLKDGTMVVVDDGKRHISKAIIVVVTSILQTNTGRMVFARPLNNASRDSRQAAMRN